MVIESSPAVQFSLVVVRLKKNEPGISYVPPSSNADCLKSNYACTFRHIPGRKKLTAEKGEVMFRKSILALLIMTTVTFALDLNEAKAGFPGPPGFPPLPGLPAPNVNVSVNGFLPAPPGVNIMIDSGRPYYVERDRRVYMERERPVRHYKKYKRHHMDHDHDRGHGRGHGRD